MDPDLPASLAVLAVAMVLGGAANWQLRKPAHQRLWPAVPWLAVHYGWQTAFYVAAGICFICMFPWFIVNPNRRLHLPEQVMA